MIRGVIFDLDGTLIDSLPGIAASLNHALVLHGRPPYSQAEVRRFIGNGSFELARRALGEESLELALAVEAAFKGHYQDHWPAGTRPYAGVEKALATLAAHGLRLAVLSNKPHPFTVEIVEKVFPALPFDAVLGQQEGVPRKPHPQAALDLAARWRFPPADCLFVGDSLVDLETARRGEMPFLGVSWGYHEAAELRAAGASGIAAEPAELARAGSAE